MSDAAARLSRALSGRYTVEREIGLGGMATVYLAHDVRHDRPVALKVLRPELASILGSERFLSEIKTTAHLQHPHILPLHDSGESDGLVFYVMPYVEGESLRDRLSREKQLPVGDAVRIASEVADALAYAHGQGVVHRDIKPENILLHGGHALVADFGIALAVSRTEGGTRLTETGLSLGTPAYMAPEQAMGEREITPKADIYALGCVVYEMLTGAPPFTGPTAQAIVARVMTEEPRALTLQRRTIPAHVEAAVLRALEKLPADRFAGATDFAAALANPGFARQRLGEAAAAPAGWSGVSRWSPKSLAPWLLVAFLGVAAAWGWLRGRPSQAHPVARFVLSLPSDGTAINLAGGNLAMSPDGGRIAYPGRNGGHVQLYLQSLDRLEPVPIPGTEDGVQPFFSPDGLWLAYLSHGRVMRVSLSGGTPVQVCAVDSGFSGGTWGIGDVIVFATIAGLRRVPAAGGKPAVVTTTDSTLDQSHRWPELLPDGKTVLFTLRGVDGVDRLAAVALAGGAVKRFQQEGASPRYVAPGYVLLANLDGTVVAVPFDAGRDRVTGPAIPVVEGVGVGLGGAAKLGVSRDGALAYATGSPRLRSIMLVDRHGVSRPLTTESRAYIAPRFSPDGRYVAVTINDGNGAAIWIWDTAQKTLTRLTFDRNAFWPVWTPDGKRVTYATAGRDADVAWIRADGSAPAETLLAGPPSQFPEAWTPDGRALLYTEVRASSIRQMMYLELDSARTRHLYHQSRAMELTPTISPDGHWVAYSSNESSRFEVYVRSFPDPGGKVQVSLDGGSQPVWSSAGRELFYRSGDRMMVASVVTTGSSFSVRSRTELFRGGFDPGAGHTSYDVSRDGRHLLMTQGTESSGELVVVLHWFDHLRFGRARNAVAGR